MTARPLTVAVPEAASAAVPSPTDPAHPPATAPARPRAPRPGSRRDPLRRAITLLDVDRARAGLAVVLGALGLGCAIALAAVAAWLIARASQMPPVLDLSIATVAVRAFGIGRGTFRYVERLVSHNLALRGMAALRTTLYARLAVGRPEATLTVRRGDLLARVGADVDTVGDAVVRGLLPAAVATVLGIGTVVAMGAFLPAAGASLAACLLLAGVVAPWLAARGATRSEHDAAEARAAIAAVSLGALDDAGPLAVQGRTSTEIDALRRADADLARATDAGAGRAALAAALGTLAVGLAVLAALVLGIPAVAAGRLTSVELAVIVLTPLAAFEATALLPAAAVQLQRSRAASARIMELLDSAATVPTVDAPHADAPHADAPRSMPAATTTGTRLVARDLVCAWPGSAPVVSGLDLDLSTGRSIAVVGPSGTGKTTLLLTLAGLLAPAAGSVRLDGEDVHALPRARAAAGVALTAEDAHVFETTLLENLRVARGDVTSDDALVALTRAGLAEWVGALPDGLGTMLGSDAQSVSGGERRRLLLARALLAPAALMLVDEPGEHLDTATADRLVTDLLTQRGSGASARGVVVVTHRLTPLAAADEVIVLDRGRVRARGTHDDLLRRDASYREAHARESQDPPEDT